MSRLSKSVKALVIATGLVLAVMPPAQAAEDSHSGGHTDGGHSDGHSGDEGGKGKGPMYMGGNSSQAHKGGSHHHDGTSGGSKSTEDKIFHGHESETESHDGGTEHSQ
jgi:hypothetical protein